MDDQVPALLHLEDRESGSEVTTQKSTIPEFNLLNSGTTSPDPDCDVTKHTLSPTGGDTSPLSIMARVRHVDQLEAELGREISFPDEARGAQQGGAHHAKAKHCPGRHSRGLSQHAEIARLTCQKAEDLPERC